MARDTFLPWTDYITALGLGLLVALVVVLVIVFLSLAGVPDEVPIVAGIAVAVGYVMAFADVSF